MPLRSSSVIPIAIFTIWVYCRVFTPSHRSSPSLTTWRRFLTNCPCCLLRWKAVFYSAISSCHSPMLTSLMFGKRHFTLRRSFGTKSSWQKTSQPRFGALQKTALNTPSRTLTEVLVKIWNCPHIFFFLTVRYVLVLFTSFRQFIDYFLLIMRKVEFFAS